tara:strand:+ start:527 stop:1612 length:1086 start_codon:yes stop_codon:yes gene_type:complete
MGPKNIDETYTDLLREIMNSGYTYDDPYRKGVQRKEISHFTLKHDLTKSFPAISVKQLYFITVQQELLWFLSGSTKLQDLHERNVKIWDEDGYKHYKRYQNGNLDYKEWLEQVTGTSRYGKNFGQPRNIGDLGRIYPAQWRDFTNGTWHVDQITRLIDGMRERPLATDLIVTAWNPAELHEMALPPCHYGFQILGRPLPLYKRRQEWIKRDRPNQKEIAHSINQSEEANHKFFDEKRIPRNGFILEWQQRSVDTFLGLPFNIASYALLAHILGRLTNMVPLGIIGNLKKVHLYSNALEETKELLKRPVTDQMPKLVEPVGLNYKADIDDFLESIGESEFGKYKLDNYDPQDAVKVKMLARD